MSSTQPGSLLRAGSWLLLTLIILVLAAVAFVQLLPQQATVLAVNLERSISGLSRHEIVLPGGLRYAYLEGGKGEPLLLLHGFGGNKDNFTRIARHLTDHYRVIIPDQIGFGESSHPATADYRSAAQAENLHQLIQALGITRLHIGGNSMGGHIAMAYADRYPDETQSLWLLDPGGVWSAPKTTFIERALAGQNGLLIKSPEDYIHLYQVSMSQHPYIPKSMLRVMAQPSIANEPLEVRIFEQISQDDIEARATHIQTPSLIVWGSEDQLISPQSAAILHKLLNHSEVIIMPGVGHLPMLEVPEQSAQDYLNFRKTLAQH